MNTASAPTIFEDSLSLRAKNLRFRGVGNPYAFLDEIGIVPIKEFLFRGANIIDIADTLNIPLTLIHTWIEKNAYGPDIEEASVISAEGYIFQGEKMLKNATTKFDLDKAKAMLEHGRFMASKKNKKLYGNQQDVAAGPVGVTYVFNVGSAPQAQLQARAVIEDAEFKELETVSFTLGDEFDLGPLPPHLRPKPAVISKPASRAVLPDKPVERVEIPTGKDTWNR